MARLADQDDDGSIAVRDVGLTMQVLCERLREIEYDVNRLQDAVGQQQQAQRNGDLRDSLVSA